ncbi:MAG: flagellar protein FlaG [Psychrobacillus sp.]|uniref:flagellar protein FlaG n=1 Tax=Solibacillus sp. FSL R7-0682 TaxID=2921690 RepID=UPI0030F933E1
MRILEHANTDTKVINKAIPNKGEILDSEVIQVNVTGVTLHALDRGKLVEDSQETKIQVKDVVNKMNEMLEVNQCSSKFIYHEGLDRYYVTVVNRDTEEVVKEIPPKRLLDAFYEMQKMLGMIVDEKI